MTISPAIAFEISQMIYTTWELVDTADGIGIDKYFAADGTLAFGSVRHSGQEQIREVYAGRSKRGPRTARHLVSNPIFVSEGDVIVVRYQLTLYAADGMPPLPTALPLGVIDVTDRVALVDGVRFLASRHLVNVFKSATEGFAVAFVDEAPAKENAR